MNISDLRALMNRAAAVIEDPTSESAEDRDHLAEQLAEAAEALEQMILTLRPDNERERFRAILKNDAERRLFAKMTDLADTDPDYSGRLDKWINVGSTLELRELVRRFGGYMVDLAFSNVVDGLDSAHLRFSQSSV